MKKIIIACDSYKGCLSSREVNEAIASGLKEWNADDAASEIKKLSPDAASPEIICLEMSDGGRGNARCLSLGDERRASENSCP